MGKVIAYRALAARVIVVAVTGNVKDWTAYIDAVPGVCHEHEYESVANTGEKISKEMATLIFPSIAEEYTWRD
jgi:hypothetical protein